MTARTNNSLRARWCLVLIAAACGGWVWTAAAAAQEPKKSPPAAPSTKAARPPVTPPAAAGTTEPWVTPAAPSTVIFHLKHAKAEEMAKLLAGTLATEKARFSLGVDSRTNSLVFQGPPEAAKLVEAILMKFDRAESQPERAMHVFQLKFAEAQDVAKVLTGTLEAKNARWSVDSRRNCIVLYGTQEAADLAKKLIAELDRPAAPREPEAETRVYRVKYADPSTVLAVLQTMLAGHGGVRVALDPKTNSVVMAAPPEQLNTAAQLIERLDVPDAGRAGAKSRMPCQFRIVWLASGVDPAANPAPTDDLKDVVEELSRIGVEGVRQVGQMVVNTLTDGQFQVSCSPLFNGEPAQLGASGKFLGKEEPLQLSLQLTATQLAPAAPGRAGGPGFAGAERRLVNLETVIAPRFDSSYIVLGVAPVGKVTSIFVVQATER